MIENVVRSLFDKLVSRSTNNSSETVDAIRLRGEKESFSVKCKKLNQSNTEYYGKIEKFSNVNARNLDDYTEGSETIR